ncbi:MAG: ATP-binding protein [Gammaproteobacteria bacterium]|nr:ATP-binding protein [Gammaproteobacteria bacterium]MCP5135532.1 ATP-binding protein [Gammaproteobacteria bacterium]
MQLPANTLVRMCIPAKATSLRLMRAVVSRAAELAGADPELTERLVLAVNEAGMNVIQHAYGDQGTRDELEGDLEIEIQQDAHELVFIILDHAPPVSPERIHSRPLDEVRPGGLGVHFIQEIMDKVEYSHLPNGEGNRLEMRKRLA